MTVRALSAVSLDKGVVSTPIPPFQTSSPPTDPLLATIQILPHLFFIAKNIFIFLFSQLKDSTLRGYNEGGLLTQQKSGLSSSLAYGSLTAFFILCFSTSGFRTKERKIPVSICDSKKGGCNANLIDQFLSVIGKTSPPTSGKTAG